MTGSVKPWPEGVHTVVEGGVPGNPSNVSVKGYERSATNSFEVFHRTDLGWITAGQLYARVRPGLTPNITLDEVSCFGSCLADALVRSPAE